jgi:hypothetical protein
MAKRCGYGPPMLIVRRSEPFDADPICTILGGVFPRSWLSLLPNVDGELLRMILNAGARLGVSKLFGALAERTKRCAEELCSCFGGDDGGMGPSLSSACVTFENVNTGGGSSSESLSLTSICLIAEPLVEYALLEGLYVDIGELRRRCGRGACCTAAIRRLKFLLTRLLSLFFEVSSSRAPLYPREKYSAGFNEGPDVVAAVLLLSSLG